MLTIIVQLCVYFNASSCYSLHVPCFYTFLCADSVSYTHLDVYKRQPYARARVCGFKQLRINISLAQDRYGWTTLVKRAVEAKDSYMRVSTLSTCAQ